MEYSTFGIILIIFGILFLVVSERMTDSIIEILFGSIAMLIGIIAIWLGFKIFRGTKK